MDILLVDDEPSIRELLGLYLGRIGHTVQACENGLQAWTWLNEPDRHCDVVIADIKMPVMDGRELLRRIIESGHDVPVVLVSGQVNVTEGDALYAGAVRIIHKPFQFAEITGILREIDSARGRGS